MVAAKVGQHGIADPADPGELSEDAGPFGTVGPGAIP
jgi:hypothetical protein